MHDWGNWLRLSRISLIAKNNWRPENIARGWKTRLRIKLKWFLLDKTAHATCVTVTLWPTSLPDWPIKTDGFQFDCAYWRLEAATLIPSGSTTLNRIDEWLETGMSRRMLVQFQTFHVKILDFGNCAIAVNLSALSNGEKIEFRMTEKNSHAVN